MKRRSFLKGVGTMIGLSFVNPIALIPEVTSAMPVVVSVGNSFVTTNAMIAEALALLEEDLIFFTSDT